MKLIQNNGDIGSISDLDDRLFSGKEYIGLKARAL